MHHAENRQDLLLAAEHTNQRRLGLGVAGLKLGQENAGQLAHAGCVAEVVLHEHLDRAPAAAVVIAHARGNLDLKIKGQLVHRTLADVVEMPAHGPEKVLGAVERIEFLLGKEARCHKARRVGHPVQVLADPVQRLQVAQPALAFLYVRLQHIALATLPAMPLGPFL